MALWNVYVVAIAAYVYLLYKDTPSEPRPFDDGVVWPTQPRKEPVADLGRDAHLIAQGLLHGPETAIVGPDGAMYAFERNGYVTRVLESGRAETVRFLGGRPLGGAFAPDGSLLVADGMQGLLRVNLTGGPIEILCNADEHGNPLNFVDDVDVGSDGRAFFTDATRFRLGVAPGGLPDELAPTYLTITEGVGSGKLMEWDPASASCRTLVDGLHFANGVALDRSERWVAVAESMALRVSRVYVAGPQRGRVERLIEGLPAHPDGVSRSPSGRGFWVALPTKVSPLLPLLMRLPWLRWVLARLPFAILDALKPRYGGVGLLYEAADGQWTMDVAEDENGGRVCFPTSVVERADGDLVLGFVHADHVAIYRPWQRAGGKRTGAGGDQGPAATGKQRDEL